MKLDSDMTMAPSLGAFFAATSEFFAGRLSHADWRDTLGPSPSAPSRHVFYPRLMAANVRRILRAVFPVLADVFAAPSRAGLTALPSWAELCADYVSICPSSAWAPNALGDGLPDYLAVRTDLPEGLTDLAAWSLQLLRAGVEGPANAGSSRLAPGVSAAPYTFDVAAYFQRFSEGSAHLADLAAARLGPPVILVAYRDPVSLRVRVLRPSAAILRALGVAAGELAPPAEPAPAYDSALASLIHKGLIADQPAREGSAS